MSESDPTIQVIHGDCLDVMRGMPDASVDAIITDPPFGVRAESWDDMDAREFARFSMSWLSEARRIAPELVTFCTQDSPIIPLCEMLYRRVRRMIWHKPEGSQYAGGRECRVWLAYEVILHCHGRPSWSVVSPKSLEVAGMIRLAREAAGLSRGAVDTAIRGKKTVLCFRWEEAACLPTEGQSAALKGLLRFGPEFDEALCRAREARDDTLTDARAMASEHAADFTDVYSHRTVTKGRHPCEKPLALMTDLLESVGKDYTSVLDPFAGSGSTLVACQKSGRRGIGIESDPKYIAVINSRVSAAATPLFR